MEIGHGNAAGAGTGGGAGSAAGGIGATGATDDGGAPPDVLGGSFGNSSGDGPVQGGQGGNSYGGPIPLDNGPQAETSKVDLLLAVDNSISMSDKQRLFAKAVPELVKRLVNPRCVNTKGQVVSEPATPGAACPVGSLREYEPLRDLHVGVITSSLGSHGATGAKDVCVTADDNDHAHLIPSVRSGIPSYNDTGYLNWDPDGSSNPPGESDAQAFADSLGTMITAAGEHGCGYEAQLESVYRFLVDPDPPKSIQLQGSTTIKVGTDTALLQQRESFLRADSSVVVLLLTDENDCSIMDEGYGWLIARSSSMYRSTSQCATNPNDTCCQACVEQMSNPGCPDIHADSECVKGNVLPMGSDDLNLRCWQQKRRFGFSLLYPTSRYVSGFGDGDVPDRNGQLVPNPLFHRGGVNRDRSLFTLSVIGGVPWQDLATAASLQGGSLEYMTSAQLTAANRWATILGDPDGNTPPTDPFMVEQPDERSGQNPITGDKIVASSSMDPLANAINGHEQVNVANGDLQYACTFPLPEPKTCDATADAAGIGCDCFAEDQSYARSVCNPPAGGPAGTVQYYGRAYPALREFSVAQELGRRSVLGSICARNTQDDSRSDYGYRPVFDAIGRRVAATLVKP